MSGSSTPEPDLLKALLEPLLEDFQYWFERSQTLLESQPISFLSNEQQADLLARVLQAQREVQTAKLLLKATGGKVGVEAAVMVPWHSLVTECWQVSSRFRLERIQSQDSEP
ncbi:DUF2605 domain-containing protein [Thermoleptolyngbya oregonensis NK1-22]|uniref:DUF2605 domain-containing protein n=1 Tax=Thermoleptolyngbya oregonensis NK1-22 TaxID=2547457 RepID=A0AA96Y4I8_9CYAN|nr:DUF2605 domain-containing protein [Thermoleptolyngbya oregonensis]WOB42514.1 DUF2605 domain-containing protein [Thermoleptolyngbya oregonensis NK1-22]